MTVADLQHLISQAYLDRAHLADPQTRDAILDVIARLDQGDLRVAERVEGQWRTNAWVKEAILLYIAIQPLQLMDQGILQYHDKIPTKRDLDKAGVRVVPPGVARYGSYLEPGCI